MTNINLRAAAVAALVHFSVAVPAGASVVGGEVDFDETRCPGNCAGSAVNPFTGVNSIATVSTTIASDPVSLGGDLVEASYLGGNSFGFEFSNVSNPSLGGIISGIDLDDPDSEITSITISYTGETDNAMLFSAFLPHSIAVFVETADPDEAALITDLTVQVDLALSAPPDSEVVTNTGTGTGPVTDPSPVPLPAGLPMMLAALGGLGLMARRTRS